MTLRHQLPALSPLGPRAVGAALRAVTFGTPPTRRDTLARAIAGALDAERALLTDSGTGALTLALRATVARGSAVALPAYGCYDLATACDGAGVDAILYDVEPDTLGPDVDSVRAALRLGASAVVTAPPYGFTTHVARVREVCDEHGIPMIEDVAQCLWAETGCGPAGTLGDFVVLSFGRGKGVTSGRGGALVTRAESPRAPGSPASTPGWHEALMLLALWCFGRPALFGFPSAVPALRLGETIYRPFSEPRPMSDVAVAVLWHTWPRARNEVERRRENAGRLLGMLAEQQTVRPCHASDGSVPSYLRLPALVPDKVRRAVGAGSVRRLGIMPGYPGSLSTLAGFGHRCRNGDAAFPGARELVRHLITFPAHSHVSERDHQEIAAWIDGLASIARDT